MDKATILSTKSDILKGLSKRHTFKPEGAEFEITIRPLRDSEFEECEAIEAGSIDFDFGDGGKQMQHMNPSKMGGVKIKKMDMNKILKADKKSKRLKVAYGLSIDEEWTIEDVKQLPTGVVDEIAAEVERISGLKPTSQGGDVLEFFRQNGFGGDDLSSNQVGSSISGDGE